MTALMLDELMLECLRNCTECHQVCLQTAVTDGVADKISANDLKLLVNCAEMCQTSADFMATISAYHKPVCRVCSEICNACALMCEDNSDIEVMRDCAAVCRKCEDSCRRMAAM